MSITSPNVLFICRLFNDVASNSEYMYKHRSDQRLDDGTRQKKRRIRKEMVVAKFYGHVPADIRNREPPTANQKRQLSQSPSATATVSF